MAVERFNFTTRRLERIPLPGAGRVIYRDTATKGLCLFATRTARTFYWYAKVGGRPVQFRLGTFPAVPLDEARRLAAKREAERADGRDPGAERRARRHAPTLADLFTYWHKAHSEPRKRTAADDKRMFEKYVPAALKARRLETIGGAEVLALHNRIGAEHGKYQANRVRALLSAMFSKAAEIGYLGANPCLAVAKFPEQSRERFLKPEELKPFFEALAEEEPDWRDFFLLCLLTGARRGNVAAMEWKEIDFSAALWAIPSGKSKSGRALTIPLVPAALAVLSQRAGNGSPWVFPARSAVGHIIDPRKAWERVRKASGLADLRMHDLRRSLGSWQAALGSSLPIIGASLGHSDPKATAIYSRLQVDPVRKSITSATAAMLAAGGVKLLETEDGGRDDG